MPRQLLLTIKGSLLLAIPMLGGLGWSCSSDVAAIDEPFGRQQTRTAIDIEATIEAPSSATRGVVAGSFFKNDGTESIGFFVYRTPTAEAPDPYVPLYEMSGNVGATLNKVSGQNTWIYNYDNGTANKFRYFYVLRDVGETHTADFLAYSPWIAGTTSLEAINFSFGNTIAGQPDMMWATENADRAINRITPGVGQTINADGEKTSKLKFHFKHVLSCIEFRFRSRKVANNADVRITKLDINHVDGGPMLYTGGTMNALTGALTVAPTATAEHITYSAGNIIVYAEDYTVVLPVLVIPQSEHVAAMDDDDTVFHFDFYFNNGAGSTSLHGFNVTRAMLRHSDSSAGLQAGHRYIFKFTIDNYTHLDGISIDDEWQEPEVVEYPI